MITINDDKQLRTQLETLDLEEQRKLALIFVENIMYLSTDEKIQKIYNTSRLNENLGSTNTAEDKLNAYQQIKSIMVKTYTDCGCEADWGKQAEHFVAAALMASITPDEKLSEAKSLVWKTAMHARMAKNCELIEKDLGETDSEATKQYRLTEEFIQNRIDA